MRDERRARARRPSAVGAGVRDRGVAAGHERGAEQKEVVARHLEPDA
jgi:hypothetical protein